ncbi:NIDM subunit of mitochondrial NADH:ubiquinone oxidoreductase (complex I), putative [Geotrichum candidum]|uniref:NIDM subunit of mitochondrial NADH:ubiquinone oxidoreductase (Complex I), putative n=1 Tax=Geotrichum candidum TaxID=1173061 RepID=A0A0J9X955_GEOCN|nr:NIDM subunit of mitochondrial NADH:ubiquinone oxidoreductase (complex I), putative [Geotrichum candidum]
MRSQEHIRPESVSFDDIDYSDAKALRSAQDSLIREQWIRVEALKTVRRALEKCFQTQGPNQYENCKDIAEKYLDMLPTHRVQGYLAYQRNDPRK